MGLVKTRRLAAMQKQQRAKAGMRPPCKDRKVPVPRAKFPSGPRRPYGRVMGNERSAGDEAARAPLPRRVAPDCKGEGALAT